MRASAGLKPSFMHGLSEEFLADLGRVIAAWSHVEHSFSLLYLSRVVMLGKGSGSMSDPRVKMMGYTFDRRVSGLRSRMRELNIPDAALTDVESLLDKLVTLRKERDEIAHSIWNVSITKGPSGLILNSDRATGFFKSWKNEQPHKQNTITQARLKDLFSRIDAVYWELHRVSLDANIRMAVPKRPAGAG